MPIYTLLTTPTTQNFFSGLTSADFQGVLAEVTSLVPVLLPVVIGYIAFRKGWSFIKSTLRKA